MGKKITTYLTAARKFVTKNYNVADGANSEELVPQIAILMALCDVIEILDYLPQGHVVEDISNNLTAIGRKINMQ